MAELESVLAERSAEAEATRSGLEAFRLRYRQEVGLLHDQLDALELAIAEAELGELSKKLEDAGPAASHRLGRGPTLRRDSRPMPSASCFATSRRPSTPTSRATRPRATGVTP